ncbi:MAG: membrane dipeptidase [Arachnia sp.]
MARTSNPRGRRILASLVAVIVAGATAFFVAAPGIVEKSRNRVAAATLPPIDEDTRALHASLDIVDMHSDTLMWKRNLLERASRGHVDLPRLEDGNVALQVFSSVTKSPRGLTVDANTGDSDNITLLAVAQLQPPRTWTSLLERSLYHGQKLEKAAADSGGRLVLVRSKADLTGLLAARASGRHVTGALFSVEGLHNLEGNPGNVGTLFDAGMRMAGFAHFFDNEAAGSMHGMDRGGLTDIGRQVFDDMERRGIIVDVAHVSPAAVSEILQRATRPVVSSHGGVQATCPNNRNLTDEQIRGVAETGGVVGVGYWNAAVCDRTPAAVVDAIEHVIDVGGLETAALGSDFDGSVTVGWDTSQIDSITQELRDRGRTDDEVRAIMGGNTLRVMLEVLPD